MVVHLILTLYASIFFEIFPFFWDIIDGSSFKESKYFYITVYLFFFVINYFFCNWKEEFNNNEDILYKFFNFCFRAVSIFLTLLFAEMKKYFYFLKNFEYKESFNTFKLLTTLKIGILFIIWRPLFRKWSYFGFYKTNRSKWWKNK